MKTKLTEHLNNTKSQSSGSSGDSGRESMPDSEIVNNVVVATDGSVRSQTEDGQSDDDDGDWETVCSSDSSNAMSIDDLE